MELTSKQRAQLRGLANTIDTIIHIGKDGIGENLVKQADDALEARELIKGRVLENNIDYDARTAAEELAKATRSEVVQVIGTKFVLYRESHSKPREKRIQLVKSVGKRPHKHCRNKEVLCGNYGRADFCPWYFAHRQRGGAADGGGERPQRRPAAHSADTGGPPEINCWDESREWGSNKYVITDAETVEAFADALNQLEKRKPTGRWT